MIDKKVKLLWHLYSTILDLCEKMEFRCEPCEFCNQYGPNHFMTALKHDRVCTGRMKFYEKKEREKSDDVVDYVIPQYVGRPKSDFPDCRRCGHRSFNFEDYYPHRLWCEDRLYSEKYNGNDDALSDQ